MLGELNAIGCTALYLHTREHVIGTDGRDDLTVSRTKLIYSYCTVHDVVVMLRRDGERLVLWAEHHTSTKRPLEGGELVAVLTQ